MDLNFGVTYWVHEGLTITSAGLIISASKLKALNERETFRTTPHLEQSAPGSR